MPENNRQITATDDGPQWLTERRKGIGGTDTVVLMGAGTYQDETPYFVWLKKVEGYNIPDNPAMERGRMMEPLVVDKYQQESGNTLMETGLWVHKDHPEIIGSPDRLVVDEEGRPVGGFEAKTTLSRTARTWDGLPARFEWQARHYMALMDVDWWDVGALVIDTWEMHYWRVERDEAKERALIAAGTEFWRTYVEPRIPPEPGEIMSPVEVATRYRVASQNAVDLDAFSPEGERVAALLAERSELAATVKEAKSRQEEVDTALKAAAGESEEVLLDGVRAYSWRPQERASLDVKRLRKDHPELADEYTRQSEFRALRVE